MITACALLSASALPEAFVGRAVALHGHGHRGLELQRGQRGLHQPRDFRAARVVEVRHADARHADGRQVLHQRLRLAREGGAHEVARAGDLVARRIRHRIAAHHGRAALVEHLGGGRRGAGAHAAEEGEGAVLAEQLFVVGHGLLGHQFVVERHQPDLAAREPALRVDRIEGQPRAGHHHLDGRAAQLPGRADRQRAHRRQHQERLVERGQPRRAGHRVRQRIAVRRDAPLQHDGAQAHAGRAAHHAQEVDGARALRDQFLGQRPHRAQVERRQDEAQADAPDDGEGHQQHQRLRRGRR
jgi:hypothetical protein